MRFNTTTQWILVSTTHLIILTFFQEASVCVCMCEPLFSIVWVGVRVCHCCTLLSLLTPIVIPCFAFARQSTHSSLGLMHFLWTCQGKKEPFQVRACKWPATKGFINSPSLCFSNLLPEDTEKERDGRKERRQTDRQTDRQIQDKSRNGQIIRRKKGAEWGEAS